MLQKLKPISILFIGNSFSYYHNMPKLIVDFVRASHTGKLFVDGVFQGGASLKTLWRDGKALKKIQSKNWDYVVLQERGRLGGVVKRGVVYAGRPQVFAAYATRFDKEIKKVGAETILYCPPAFLGIGRYREAEKLQAVFARLAKKIRAAMIPAVRAFMLAKEKRPDLNLYERDGNHPNPLGMYFVAALFYKKLFHKKIANFPLESYLSRSKVLLKNPKKVKLAKADVRFLWSIAGKIMRAEGSGQVVKRNKMRHES